MHERLNRGLTFGLIGNALFIAFAFITLVLFYRTEGTSKILEVLAYACDISGFFFLMFGNYLIITAIRGRLLFKIGFTLYIIMEALMMVLELNSFEVSSFYKPYSLALAIFHSLISAAVCFSFLYLDPYKTSLEVTIIICVGLILGGMFGNIIGVRIYFSIFVNAVAYTALFITIKKLIAREDIEIDCHGDSAREAVYSNVFFDDDKKKKPAASGSEKTEPAGGDTPADTGSSQDAEKDNT